MRISLKKEKSLANNDFFERKRLVKFHIVCEGETLKKIAFLYGLSEEELQKENKHIRVWERLIPGTKLKIPTISEAVDQDINGMEPFVEDYYPKLKLDVSGMSNPQSEVKVEIKDNLPSSTNEIKQTAEVNDIKTLNENTVLEPKTSIKPNIEDIPELKHYQNANNYPNQTIPVNMYQYPYLVYYSYPRYVYPQYVYPVYVYPQYQNKV